MDSIERRPLSRRTCARIERAVRLPISPTAARWLLAVSFGCAALAVAGWGSPLGWAGSAGVVAVAAWTVGRHRVQQRALERLSESNTRLSSRDRLEVAVRIVEHPERLGGRFDTRAAHRVVSSAWTVNGTTLNNTSAFVLAAAVEHRIDTTGVDLRRLAELVHDRDFSRLRSGVVSELPDDADELYPDPFTAAATTLEVWDRARANDEVGAIFQRLVDDGQTPLAAIAAAELLAADSTAQPA